MKCQIIVATEEHKELLQQFNEQLCQLEHEKYDATINPRFSFSPKGNDCFDSRIKDNGAFLAVVDGAVVGYLTASIDVTEEYRFPGMIAMVESIFVIKEFRSMGIGTDLLEYFKLWAKEREATRMRIVASVKNKKAIELYEKNGFTAYDIVLEQEVI